MLRGFISGILAFEDDSELHFCEFIDLTQSEPRLMYAYHYQDSKKALVFRYDNAAHRPLLLLAEHKHTASTVSPAPAPTFMQVIDEIFVARGEGAKPVLFTLEPGRVILHIGSLTTADMTEMEPFTLGFESTINQPCAPSKGTIWGHALLRPLTRWPPGGDRRDRRSSVHGGEPISSRILVAAEPSASVVPGVGEGGESAQ